jgi:hypothetical protein
MIRGVLCAAVACLLLVASSEAGSINATIKCHDGSRCAARGFILLQSSTEKSILRRINLNLPSIVISGQPGSEWDLTLDAKGFWALPQHIVFPPGVSQLPLTIDIWRTGTLQGDLKFPDPQPSGPVAVKVVVSSRPEPRVQPELPRGTSFDCSSDNTGRWKCAIPATLLDVAIRVDGYAPYHKWDVKMPVDGVIDLGPVKLQKGASLLVWLDTDFAKLVRVPVHAILRHEAAAGTSATAIRLGVPVAEEIFTKKGVAQLSPLAPGRYILETQAKGYAPARIPVQLYEGKETTPRRSIDMQPALTVRLRLEPPVGPGGFWWRVELWRRTDSGSGSQDAGNGIASPEGIFTATDQVEGPLRVYLKDTKRNILANREILITPNTAEYTIRLDVSSISGKVTIGDSPLASAKLLFGGSGGAEKVSAVTDADGNFTVTLPKRGKWIVDVDAPREAVATTTEVLIEKDEVNIKLPLTEVSGWVRDADGKRLPGVPVMLSSSDRPLRRITEADGVFRFRSIPPGTARLRATDPRTHDYSKDLEVSIPENGEVNNVELTLENVRQIKGAVHSNGEVVVGALVHGYAVLAGTARQEQATTDLAGGFALDVPNSVTDATVVVASPGRTLESFSVSTNQDPISLELAGRGGTLKLQWTPGAIPLQFTFNDHFLPSSDVFVWARSQRAKVDDGKAEIPNVAPGKYRFCSTAHCAEGYLSLGGQLSLDATH